MANKITATLKALAFGVTFTVCASASAEDVLRVGTEGTLAPFEFVDVNDEGKLIGYDIDISEAIAKDLGMKLEVVNMPFDGLIPALMTSQIDMIAAGMTITPERAKRVDFSAPYYKSGLSVLVREDSKDKYQKVSDVSGKPLCAQIGTTGARHAEKLSPNQVKSFNTQTEVFLELKAGGCEAIVNDRPVNLYYMAQNPNSGTVEINEIISAEDYGIAVRKGNTELLEKVNKAMEKIKASGEMAKIHKKWFSVEE